MCDAVLELSTASGPIVVCRDIQRVDSGLDGHHHILFVLHGGRFIEVLRVASGLEYSSPPAPTPPILATHVDGRTDSGVLRVVEDRQYGCRAGLDFLEARRQLGFPAAQMAKEKAWIEKVCAAQGEYRWNAKARRFIAAGKP